jgi:hypothetical protein
VSLGALAAALAVAASTGATVSPATATLTLRAGDPTLGVGTESKQVDVPAVPPKADIELAIDTTGSMGPSIAQAQADANAIVSGVQGVVADTQFAVVQFKDAGDSPEYQVVQAMTPNASDVQTALAGLSAFGGGDAPEAYNTVFHNSYTPDTGGDIGWRSGTRKFVVVIGDAEPHGAGSAGFAGCADASADPNGFNTATEIAGMNSAGRTLFMIRQVSDLTTTSLACYDSLAANAFPVGDAQDAGGSFAAQIVALINAAYANVNDVHMEVVSAAPAPANASWIGFSPASVGPVPAPSTQNFTLTATVPGGTPSGSYTFDIRAVADGVDIGHQTLTIVVPAKQITLDPATSSNPIGTSHTVTATVFDTLGPFVGDTVSFEITAGPDAGDNGAAATDSAGEATFTFTNSPPDPGTDTIVATVHSDDGPVSATASKEFFNTPPDCSGVVLDVTSLWPPNHKLRWITLSGATDVDIGDSAALVVDGVTQDEPVNGAADGNTSPDAFLTTPLSNQVRLRAERLGPGDGRVDRLPFPATHTHGATCDGTALVGVPHDQGGGATAIDSAPPSFVSTGP